MPWELVVTRPHFARAVHGIRPPGGVYCHVVGLRPGARRRRLLEGARGQRPHAVGHLLRAREPDRDDAAGARRCSATTGCGPSTTTRSCCWTRCARSRRPPRARPTVVVWTPGPLNCAYFEHAFLARQMGVELVEASDLVVRDDVVYMRTTRGLARVDAIYRRIDDDFIDPLEFRPDSLLGVPGLMRAYRAGTVAIANAHRHRGRRRQGDLPLRAGDDPLLPRRGADPRQRADLPAGRPRAARARARAAGRARVQADRASSGGKGVFIGPATPADELDGLRRRDPRAAGALDRPGDSCNLSTVPTVRRDGSLAPRHVDLRPFAVFGDDIRSCPGGLTRVALREGSMIVNSLARRRLEGHLGARGRRARATSPASPSIPSAAARAAGPALRRLAPAGAAATARPAGPPRCSPGSPTSSSGSAATSSRAEHTARMLDGVFHADLQAPPDGPARRSR